jgi:hypothetical protein
MRVSVVGSPIRSSIVNGKYRSLLPSLEFEDSHSMLEGGKCRNIEEAVGCSAKRDFIYGSYQIFSAGLAVAYLLCRSDHGFSRQITTIRVCLLS